MGYVATTQRYKPDTISLTGRDANEIVDKNVDSNTTRKMNPPWRYQSGANSYKHESFQSWPTDFQNGFSRGVPYLGPDQQAPTGQDQGYERGGYGDDFFRGVNPPNLYSGSPSGRLRGRQPAAEKYPTWGHQTLQATSPPSYQGSNTFEQWGYGQTQQQYAQFQFQHQPYQQFPVFHSTAIQPWLMQQWQPGNGLPSNSFTPINAAGAQNLNASAPPFVPETKKTRSGKKRNTSMSSYTNGRDRKRRAKNAHKVGQMNATNETVRQATLTGSYGSLPVRNSGPGTFNSTGSQIVAPSSTTPPTGLYIHPSRQHLHSPTDQASSGIEVLLNPNFVSKPHSRPVHHTEKEHFMERPQPTERYLEKAHKEPQNLKSPRPLLIVLDLNGTMLHRLEIGTTRFTSRPGTDDFLEYIFREHHVLIWSSAMPRRVKTMTSKLLSAAQQAKLIGCWGRDKLRIPEDRYNTNVHVYKQLSWVWSDEDIIAANPDPVDIWCQENTVLIDDNMNKAASEPFNAIQVEDFKGEKEQMESVVLSQVVDYLETLKYQSDVSAYIRSKPYKYNAEAA